VLQETGGNVGIGTTGPLKRLQIDETNNTVVGSSTFWNGTFGGAIIRNPSDTANTVAGLAFYQGSANNAVTAIGSIEEGTTLAALGFFTGGSGVSNTVPERMRITSSGNVGIGTTSMGASAAGVLAIGNGTQGAAAANMIQLVSEDLSAGNTIPSIQSEGTGITTAAITNVTVTNKIAVKVNGVVYYLLATTSAA
jgi:hypothetical protein